MQVYLTHFGLVMPYGCVAWRHQAITWNNVDLSSKEFFYINLGTILQEMLMSLIRNMSMEITTTSPRGQWVKIHVSLTTRDFSYIDIVDEWREISQ